MCVSVGVWVFLSPLKIKVFCKWVLVSVKLYSNNKLGDFAQWINSISKVITVIEHFRVCVVK